MGVHELRICFRDTDDDDTLKVKTLHVATGSVDDVKTRYPLVMAALVREHPVGNVVINEVSGHDAYTMFCFPVDTDRHLCLQGATLKGGSKQVSRKIAPPVGALQDEPIDKDLADAIASCGDVSWPSAVDITSAEAASARTLLGIL
tara:strand:+ start:10972 stop:11409 length:438 start_codon:yes stop_codon:yes gene_type:complete